MHSGRRKLSAQKTSGYNTIHRPRFNELQHELEANAGAFRTVDLVVARYRDDSSWLLDVERELPMVRIFVYEKGGGESICHTMRLKRATCVPLANVGREQHSFMTHLVEHHDQLADKVVFSQAGPPGNGFLSGREGGHLMPGSDFFYDYLSPLTPPRMIFTMAYANLANREVLVRRRGYPINEPQAVSTETAAPAACAGDWQTLNNSTQRFWDILHPRKPKIDLPDQLAYWRTHLQPQLGPMTDAFMPFANGAIASASGALLAARPKAFYEELQRTVGTSDRPDAIYYLELASAYVLGHANVAHACSSQIDAHVEAGSMPYGSSNILGHRRRTSAYGYDSGYDSGQTKNGPWMYCYPPPSPPPLPSSPAPQFADTASLRMAAEEFNANATSATATYGPISSWDVSAITSMRLLFFNLGDFDADISAWDISGVTDMGYMFAVRSARAHPATSSRVLPCTLLVPSWPQALPSPVPHHALCACPLFDSAGRILFVQRKQAADELRMAWQC